MTLRMKCAVTVSTIVLVWSGASAAAAAEPTPSGDQPAAIQASLDDSAPAHMADGNVVANVDDVHVVVPDTLDEPIVIGAEGSASLAVSLPGESADSTSDVSTASVSHALASGGEIVPVVRGDGTLQVLSVLNTSADPTSYLYDFRSEEGATVSVAADGGALVVDADGDEIATVAAPWATDGAGNAVTTRFVAQGSTLTQVVEPTPDAVYPIVADPAITVSSYQYEATNVRMASNQVNYSARVGGCQVAQAGISCTITGSYSVGTTVTTSFGLSAGQVAATIGISATASVSGSISCTSPALPAGGYFTAYDKGTFRYFDLQKWKVSKAGGITARSLVSTATGQKAFTPSNVIYCTR